MVDWAMAKENHEQRILDLEKEVANLRDKFQKLAATPPWWERIAVTFADDPIYEKAMKLGRDYRRAQKPNGSSAPKQK
jgi:hypothetical protein